MACELIKGYSIGCRDGIGGVKAIYLGQFEEITLTTSGGEVTDIEMGTDTLFKYTCKRGVASITETINASSEAGTVFYTHSCNLKFNKLSKEYQNELKLLAQNRLIVFAELNELNDASKNTIMCLGATHGLELMSGTGTSGVALGDFGGYDWTLEGSENEPMLEVADYTTVAFDNSAFTMGTIVTS
jgi:hypothetical protein